MFWFNVLVPKKGLEPPHPCGYMDLNHARLPIPPLRQVTSVRGGRDRLDGRDCAIYSYKAGRECQTWRIGSHYLCRTTTMVRKSSAPPNVGRSEKDKEQVARLRVFAHDLSNALEAILQACYLLGQSKLQDDSKRWVQLIDTSSQEAARINREIRKLLRSLSEE